MWPNLKSMLPGGSNSNDLCSSPRHDGYQITSHHSSDKAEERSRRDDVAESDINTPTRGIHVPGGSPRSIYGFTSVSRPTSGSLDVRDISRNLFIMGSDHTQLSPKQNGSYTETWSRGRDRSNSQDPTPPASPRGDMPIILRDLGQTGGGMVSSSMSEGSYHLESVPPVPRDENADDRGERGQTRLRAREAKLPGLRSRNSQTRARVIVSRGDLREARLDTSTADEEYMKVVREILVRQRLGEGPTKKDEVDLEAAYTQLQDARNTYGPLEETYIALEESLERQDYELMRLEDQISRYHISHFKDDDSDWDSLSSSSDEHDSESSQYVEKSDPLHSEYLSRLGDRDLLREAYTNLFDEHARLQDQQQLRQAVHTDLHPEDQVTLKNFPTNAAKIWDKLSEANMDIERLRQACIREGLIIEDADDEFLYSDGFQSEGQNFNLQGSPNGDMHIEKVSPTQSEYYRFPLLLENPCDEDEDLETSKTLLSDFMQGDIGNRITRWLLHKLRSSCSEVELLARFSSTTDGLGLDIDKDTGKWQEEVLDFWFVDSANLPRSAYEIEPTAVDVGITGKVTTISLDPDRPSPSPSAVPLPAIPRSLTIPPIPSAQPSPLLSPLSFPPSSPRSRKIEDPGSRTHAEPLVEPGGRESEGVGAAGASGPAGAGGAGSGGRTALNPQLANYAVDNSTSQRVHILVRTSVPSSLLSHHAPTMAHAWSSGELLEIKSLDVGKERGRGLERRKHVGKGRRAMSVPSLSMSCLY